MTKLSAIRPWQAGGFIVGMLLCSPAVSAQATSPSITPSIAKPAATTELATVTVTGSQPGPGLWRVSKGDHVLWILGSLSPLPKGMVWQSKDVDATIDESQVVLGSPETTIKAGFFKTLMLLPSLIGLSNNPDHAKLKQELPDNVYARWLPLKARYLGKGNAVEKRRPSIVGSELYDAAIDQSGLTEKNVLSKAVAKAAKRHGLKVQPVVYYIPMKNPRAFLKDFKHSSIQDAACFNHMLTLVSTDMDTLKARANAWAIGDVDALRKLPLVDVDMCSLQHTAPALMLKYHLTDVDAQLKALWLKTADSVLAKNKVSFATLPIRYLIKPDGYLAALQAQGYKVDQPD